VIERSYVVAGKEIEVGFYHDRSGTRAAGNVKCHELPRLPKGLAEKLEKLEAEASGTRERFECWAWESAVTSWWEWAAGRAEELELGAVYSYGRSGGYIGLDAFSEERVEGIVLDVNDGCKNCQEPYGEHCDGKCLFEPTRYTPANEKAFRVLTNLTRFLRECEESVRGEGAIATLTEEMKFYIEAEWEERMQTKRR